MENTTTLGGDPAHVGPSARTLAEQITNRCPTSYVWRYESSLAELRALYEKAKGEQWDGRTALAWGTDVDPHRELYPDLLVPIHGTEHWRKLAEGRLGEARQHFLSWTLSQFLHGEQGALLATAQIVSSVPLADAKLYAATQVMDEARHVEVYERYLREKIRHTYPINRHLRVLLDQILSDSRWDVKYLGMQILVEGLALAAFRYIHQFVNEPLLKALTHGVMLDERRHVAFGVLSLRDLYTRELSEAERHEREEFTFEACRLMRDRFLGSEIWEHFGLPVDECDEAARRSFAMKEYRRLLFSRIVPNVKRLGLLSPHLRRRFEELEILGFEDEEPDA